jgi:hypothetical protein
MKPMDTFLTSKAGARKQKIFGVTLSRGPGGGL